MRSRATAPMSAVIADDEQLAREELKFLLDQIGDVEVVAVTANGLESPRAIPSGWTHGAGVSRHPDARA